MRRTTKAAIRDLDELTEALRPLVFGLYDLVRRHSPQITTTLTQSSILSFLADEGPQRMSVLAEREGVRLPSMTDVIARLEREGYVRREVMESDRRVVLVRATTRARRAVHRVRKARHTFLRERIERLSASDRAVIERALPALERLVEREY